MWTNIQYRILKRLSPGSPTCCSGTFYQSSPKLHTLLGDEFLSRISGKVIIDFGCGEGVEAVELAEKGAKRVIGIDNREDVLHSARKRAQAAGVEKICTFASSSTELADIIISLDSFEHFSDPAEILCVMNRLLKAAGEVFVSFGPTWYHPLGGHLFSVFPWAHLIFTEKALIKWRSTFKTDGATRFCEVAGGLNQMSIRNFESLIERSAFRMLNFETVPIRKLRRFHSKLTREITTSIVRCRLVKRDVEDRQATW